MKNEYFKGNRDRLYAGLKNNSLLVLFSGNEIIKTNDEYYRFYTERNFIYLTGLESKQFILLAAKDSSGKTEETIYILPADLLKERWTGARMKLEEVEEKSGIKGIKYIDEFELDFHRKANSGIYENVYLDLYRAHVGDIERKSNGFCKKIRNNYAYLKIQDVSKLIHKLRTIKQKCEIEAMREAEKITRAGIIAMMKASKPGMYEYQYKAEYDYTLGQYGPEEAAFPSIISAGKNNFFIHYDSYQGQAHDGDMILNDVGARYDNLMTDVSRGWPCNGKFNEKQRLLYQCALATSNHMFKIIKPGMKMTDVDLLARRYNFERLKEAGVLERYEDIGTYMWHGGAHHVGYDVHDAVEMPEFIAPNMVFCVDVGIYHEEWGIGFRLEDNCLVTADGCENLSSITPRTIEEIEDTMLKGYR